MIRFACPCGHSFVRPDNDAGMVVVCPDCGVVNEIARAEALPNPRAREIQNALANLARNAVPVVDPTAPPKNLGQIIVALNEAPNLVVMLFVLVAHLLVVAGILAILANFYMVAPLVIALAIGTIAHWGNVVSDIGVEDKDEVPRLFRDLQFREDLIGPFAGMTVALVLCYGPALAVFLTQLSPANAISVAIPLGLVGTFFFPAVLLSLLTSGSPANLRPDRILGVVDACGQRYLNVVLTLILAIVPFGYAIAAISMRITGQDMNLPDWAISPGLSLPVFAVGILMLHAFCWHLGLLYRAQNDSFPWVGRGTAQEIRKPIVREKPRYVESGPIAMESRDLEESP